MSRLWFTFTHRLVITSFITSMANPGSAFYHGGVSSHILYKLEAGQVVLFSMASCCCGILILFMGLICKSSPAPHTVTCCFFMASLCRASFTAFSNLSSGTICIFSDKWPSLMPITIRSLTIHHGVLRIHSVLRHQ